MKSVSVINRKRLGRLATIENYRANSLRENKSEFSRKIKEKVTYKL